MTKRIGVGVVGVGVVGVLLLAGCSAAPGTGTPGDGELTAQTSAALTNGQILYGPRDPSMFDECEIRGATAAQNQPSFVLRLPDPDGQPTFSDGYSVPFPTPWLAMSGVQCGSSNGECTYEKFPYEFEQAVNNNVAGIVSHEFLVYQLSIAGKGYKVDTTQQYFYNGTEDVGQLGIMTAIAGSFAQDTKVSPLVLTCVYVMQQQPDGEVVFTGYHAQVAQSHDPINWPDDPYRIHP